MLTGDVHPKLDVELHGVSAVPLGPCGPQTESSSHATFENSRTRAEAQGTSAHIPTQERYCPRLSDLSPLVAASIPVCVGPSDRETQLTRRRNTVLRGSTAHSRVDSRRRVATAKLPWFPRCIHRTPRALWAAGGVSSSHATFERTVAPEQPCKTHNARTPLQTRKGSPCRESNPAPQRDCNPARDIYWTNAT